MPACAATRPAEEPSLARVDRRVPGALGGDAHAADGIDHFVGHHACLYTPGRHLRLLPAGATRFSVGPRKSFGGSFMLKAAFAAALLACLPLAAGDAVAQDYPARPIRIIVPFPPGNPADLAARLLAERWLAAWGQPVVIDNVPGAAGTIGVARAAKAAPDGYTLVLSGDAAAVTNVSLMGNLSYDPRRDFAPIMQVGSTPNLLVVRKDLPARNVVELVALARQQPGKLTYASTGIGTSQHLGGEILSQMTGIEMTHVPYKELYINDLMASRVDMGLRQYRDLPAAGARRHHSRHCRKLVAPRRRGARGADGGRIGCTRLQRHAVVRPDGPGRHAGADRGQDPRRNRPGTGRPRAARQARGARLRDHRRHACGIRQPAGSRDRIAELVRTRNIKPQ